MRLRAMLGLALGGLLVTAMAQAEVYKYVDKAGHYHYSDQPQQGWKRVDVKVTNLTPPPEEGVEEKPAVDQAKRAADCQNKKDTLQRYKEADSIRETDSLGKIKEYSAAERQQLIDATQKQVDEACGKAG